MRLASSLLLACATVRAEVQEPGPISGTLRGRTLRCAVPASRVPEHYFVNASGHPVEWYITDAALPRDRPAPVIDRGFVATYIQYLGSVAGFECEWFWISEETARSHSSAWTACVAEVGRGAIDLCVSQTWILPERLKLAAFTQPMNLDPFYLVVLKPTEDSSISASIAFVTRPFSAGLWATTFGLVLAITLIQLYIQPRSASKVDGKCEQLRNKGMLDQLQDTLHSTMMMLLRFGNPVKDDDYTGIKIVKFGYAVFVMVAVVAYGSAFTALLINGTFSIRISRMEDCVASHCRVCVSAFLEPVLRSVYTNSIRYTTQPPSFSQGTFNQWGFSALKEGVCDAALVSYSGYLQVAGDHDCEIMFVGQPVITPYMGLAINPLYQREMAYLLRQPSWPAANDFFIKRHRDPVLPNLECNAWSPDSDSRTLTVNRMAGPLLICATAVAVGLVLDCTRIYGRRVAMATAHEVSVGSATIGRSATATSRELADAAHRASMVAAESVRRHASAAELTSSQA